MNTEEWRDSAACKGHADLFLSSEDKLQAQYAHRHWAATYKELQSANFHKMKQICDSCPVRIPCLNYALSNNITFLVWGGLGANTRAKIRRSSAKTRQRRGPAREAGTGFFLPSLAADSEDVQASPS